MKIRLDKKRVLALLASGIILVTSSSCTEKSENKKIIVPNSQSTMDKDQDVKNSVFPKELNSIISNKKNSNSNYLYMINTDYIESSHLVKYDNKMVDIKEVLYVVRSVSTYNNIFGKDKENFENIDDVEVKRMSSDFFNKYGDFIVPKSYLKYSDIFNDDNLFNKKCNFTVFGSNLKHYYLLYEYTLTAKKDISKKGMNLIKKGEYIKHVKFLRLNVSSLKDSYTCEELLSTQLGIGANDENVLANVKNNYTKKSIVPISFDENLEKNQFEDTNELNEYLVKKLG